MNGDIPMNTDTVPVSSQETSPSTMNQPAKMKINPLHLLQALSVLLNEKGGIKGIEEVSRVSRLMGKYSKKLVSKCIYLNILQATDTHLLDQFFKETGWNLVSTWLADASGTINWPLTKQILDLLIASPVTVDRLKQNNSPKMVKDLSTMCEDADVKAVAERVVSKWKLVVQGLASGTANFTSHPAEENMQNVVAEIAAGQSTANGEAVVVADKDPEPELLPVAKRGRGGRTGRGRGRPRGRPVKTEAMTTPSYADLLSQDLDTLSRQDINITIRNGPKLLARVSNKKKAPVVATRKSKPRPTLIESSDSEDNMPLSQIRKEPQSTIDLTNQDNGSPDEVISIESDSQTQSDAAPSAEDDKPPAEEDKPPAEEDKPQEKVPEKVAPKVDTEAPLVVTESGDGKEKKSSSTTTDQSNDKVASKTRSHRSSRHSDRDRNKEKDKDRGKDKDKNKSKEKDKDRSKEKDRAKDKSRDSDKHKERSRDKGKESDRKSEHRDKDRSKDKHRGKSDSNKHSSATSDKQHSNSRDNKRSCDEQPLKLGGGRKQTETDKATLDKIKPLSTEGLAKIPRKPSSFLDALGAADSDDTGMDPKKPAIKLKSRGFRNTGLLDETISPPGLAGKRTATESSPNSGALKRQRSVDPVYTDKRLKTSVSSDPSALDRPGGVKLISPKRPVIADDGGFMAALTAAGPERRRITKKRRSSDSDPKPELAKIPKLDDDLAPLPESDDVKPDIGDPPVKEEGPMLSPISTRPTLNFYKERTPEEPKTKPKPIVNPEPVKEEPESSPEIAVDEPIKSPETEEKTDTEEDQLESEPAVPAPAQEDYEKIEVLHTSMTEDLKGALVYHGSASTKRKNKSVQWKSDENLTQTFLFPMDESERVNVNTLKFQDMMHRDQAFEKEHRGRFGSPDLNPNPGNNATEFLPWKLFPIHLPEVSTVVHGGKSKERHVQAQREHHAMATFFHPAMRPDTPGEPEPEMVPRTEPIMVPLKDVTGSDSVSDHRNVPWPEPVIGSPDMPFMPPAPNQMPSSQDGGHWIVGSHTRPRFGGDMFNGPVCGPPLHQNQGFPGQNFPNNMRGPCPQGGWGPPLNDFGGGPPHGMMQGAGPPHHMGMQGGPNMGGPGPNMGGPGPNMGMQGGPNMGGPGPNMNGPNMGGGPGGPQMGMQGPGGPGPIMGGRGGPRFKRGNWGQPNSRACKHFLNGHCRNGNNCRFAHNQHR